jgi:hypothetical protein
MDEHNTAEVSRPSPGFRFLSSETLPLTRELAESICNMPGSPTERERNPNRVHFLRKKVKEGLTIPFHWAVVTLDGVDYRVNGQTSSYALCTSNGSFPQNGVVHLDRYAADDVNGVVMLFRQFDPRQSARQPLDISGAYQNIHPDLTTVPKPVGKMAAESVTWYRRNVKGLDEPGGDDRYNLFNEVGLHPFVLWLSELFPVPKIPVEFRSHPIVAAMFATHGADAVEATEFWKDVVKGGKEYEDQHPSTVLFDWLKRVHDGEYSVKQKQLYQGCVYAWNAFRDGKTTLRDIRSDIKRGLTTVQ